ncbi:MAG: 3-phosphoshikimate 1-carboxyvinyltransferase [Prevotella sp.]|nr:3-phosphoshikimate 1-carboxyvinyltransferase [Prevotella sp.]
MQYIVKAPKRIQTEITLPASKSICNRALIIHALTKDSILPQNLSDCDDTMVMIRALNEMPEVIDVGAGGTAMRFMTAFLSATESGQHVITGTERMRHRPIGVLVDALKQLGATISYEEEKGYPPLRIQGEKLEGGVIEMAGNVSSQYISAVLLIGPILEKGLELRLTSDIASRPYIDLTLSIMREYGAAVEWTDINTITVKPKPYERRTYTIENDWSAASYWYEMLALSNDLENQVCLPGLLDGSLQGDSVVRFLFSMLGVKTAFNERGVEISRHFRTLTRMDYDFINQPDLAQTLVTTCCALGIPFHFTGLASLKIKETDRIEALKTELRKLGYMLYDTNNSELYWDGERCNEEEQPTIDTYEDHRMAMAFAPLAIKLGEICINNPQVVSKSYPHYWDNLRKAGFDIIETL